MKTAKIILAILSLIFSKSLSGQKSIELKNPDFEADGPAFGTVPAGWINLGALHQTPPDIQPGFFGVDLPAAHGHNYLGLVTREDNSWEGIGQRLNDFLKKDSSYTFSLWMTRSNNYVSPTIKNKTERVNFNAPTILKIWGYNTKTKEEELLAESQPVGLSKWILYTFDLHPSLADFDEIDLMVYYAYGHENQNGHLLIDNCSAIVPVH